MKKLFLFTFLLTFLFIEPSLSQHPNSVSYPFLGNHKIPVTTLQAPDRITLEQEDANREHLGILYRIGVINPLLLTPANGGMWTRLENGDRIWQTAIYYPGAEAISLFFDQFKLSPLASLSLFDGKGNLLNEIYTATENSDQLVQHIPLCHSDYIVLQLTEPKNAAPSLISLNEIGYIYRSSMMETFAKDFGESESCEININCPEGKDWQDEKKGIARILVRDGSFLGWCSGSLVNNTANDCTPYFLTAMHCGETATTSDFNQWIFYFAYEAPDCTNPATQGSLAATSKRITGCHVKATSNDGGGDRGSDFFLLQLGSPASKEATITKLKTYPIQAYWNGWDASNTAVSEGVGIHHPAGDIKKISKYVTALTTSGWNANGLLSHWRVRWSSGVTEGGSSGSPLFNYNGGNSRIIGTLTGGNSSCGGSNPVDYYGKMYYHWDKNTTSGNIKLSQFLDPLNTGRVTIDGSYDPCNTGLSVPVMKSESIDATVYPNPFEDELLISMNDIPGTYQVSLYDVSGKLVHTESGTNNELKIQTGKLNGGVYIIQIHSVHGTFVQKIIKQ